MPLLQYVYYVLLYGYLAFGVLYLISLIFKLDFRYKSRMPSLPVIGESTSLDYYSMISLENVFREIGLSQVEYW